MFSSLEEDGYLNVDDPKHICILHRIFLPRLNDSLRTFREAWSNHPLSSEHNFSPLQLMIVNKPPPESDLELTAVSPNLRSATYITHFVNMLTVIFF